jgi:hypothetical protein
MVNNIGKTTKLLNTTLGGTMLFTPNDNLTIITGELGVGFLVFDSSGILGVVTEYIDNESNFIITTHAKSIDVQAILSLNY